jgi:1-acyl-sn-glycerol-3-phosphate acyltransferase
VSTDRPGGTSGGRDRSTRPGSVTERPARRPTPRGPDPAARGLSPYIRLLNLTARTVVRSLTRVRVDGALDRIPQEGPLIVASNHLSNADGPVIAGWLSSALGRRIHWLGKREMYALPLAGPPLRGLSIHPVDRDAADVEAFRLAQRILEAGNVLLLFPEGTRSPTGALQRPRDGLALLALRTGAPILPVGLAGTERLWPRGTFPRVGGRVSVRVGESFRLTDVLGDAVRDRRAAKGLATEAIMRRIAALLPPAYRGAYADAVHAGDAAPVDGSEPSAS